MKKMIKRIIAVMLVIFLCVVVYFANGFFGNPVSKALATRSIKNYVEEKYEDVEIEKIGYDLKTCGYYGHIKSTVSQDTYFSVYTSMLGQIERDSYDNVTSGYNTYLRISREYEDLCEVAFANQNYKQGVVASMFNIKEKELNTYKDLNNGLDLSSLEIDKTYDIKKMSKDYGHIVVYATSDDVTVETMAKGMLEIKNVLAKEGIYFNTMDYELSQKDSKLSGLKVEKVLYSDIYEEGLVDRLEKEIKQLEDYYKELDKETKVD